MKWNSTTNKYDHQLKLYAKRLEDFDDIPNDAQPVLKSITGLPNPYGIYEDLVVMVFDSNEYTPQYDPLQVGVPKGIIAQWIEEAVDYCRENKEECTKLVAVFVGNLIKTVVG